MTFSDDGHSLRPQKVESLVIALVCFSPHKVATSVVLCRHPLLAEFDCCIEVCPTLLCSESCGRRLFTAMNVHPCISKRFTADSGVTLYFGCRDPGPLPSWPIFLCSTERHGISLHTLYRNSNTDGGATLLVSCLRW